MTLLLAVLAALLVQVPVYSLRRVSPHQSVVVRTGSEPLLRVLWEGLK